MILKSHLSNARITSKAVLRRVTLSGKVKSSGEATGRFRTFMSFKNNCVECQYFLHCKVAIDNEVFGYLGNSYIHQ